MRAWPCERARLHSPTVNEGDKMSEIRFFTGQIAAKKRASVAGSIHLRG